jgi:hypothetical protein
MSTPSFTSRRAPSTRRRQDDGQGLLRQKQRFVADVAGAMMFQIDDGRHVERAAITAAEESGLQPLFADDARKRDGGRRLAGAADGEIADADDRDRHRGALRAIHAHAGNPSVNP